MSYDLIVARPDIPDDCLSYVCEWEYEDWDGGRGRYFSHTYNLSPFFHAYGVCPRHDMDGHTASDVADMIDKALTRIRQEDPDGLAARYDSANGYGIVKGATVWLRRIRDYCRKHPGFKVVERS